MLRFLCLVSVLTIVLLFAIASSPGAVEPARAEDPPAIEATASHNSTSWNSSSGTIMITMTGMVGDPGDVSSK